MLKYRQIKVWLTGKKWTVLVSVWIAALVYIHLQNFPVMFEENLTSSSKTSSLIKKENHLSHEVPQSYTSLSLRNKSLPRLNKPTPNKHPLNNSLPHSDKSLPHLDKTSPHLDKSLPHLENSLPRLDKQLPQTNFKHYDVLVSSYMRGGSTLTGKLLGWRDDTFYLYEPLWKLSRWTYWHGNHTVCRADRFECREVQPDDILPDKKFYCNKYGIPGISCIQAQTLLQDIYKCRYSDMKTMVLGAKLTYALGGWREVRYCVRDTNNMSACLDKFVPRQCTNATHKVTKVLRVTTDLLDGLLRERPNLKVIHLIRDPRAIVNSRSKTPWYPAESSDQLVENAKSLCTKMLHDIKAGKTLLELYPDRFKVVYYEDLSENPFDKARVLYKYLGMDLNERKYPRLKYFKRVNYSTNDTARNKNTAYWWRTSLTWGVVQRMEPVCAEVYKEAGFKSISNEEDYRDLSISTVDIPQEHVLT